MMDSICKFSLCGFVFMFFAICNTHVHCQSFKVTDFGAIPDGKTDNKLAFEKAWKEACGAERGTLVVPLGDYLVSGAKFSGPCNGQTNVVANGNLTASRIPIPDLDYWIMFTKLDNLFISGRGAFNGNGAFSWQQTEFRRVTSLKLMMVTNVVVRSIASVNSKMFHMVIHKCKNAVIDNVHIEAPDESPNTDGIHIGVSDNITITNSFIGTGDDCISIGDGSENISITWVSCGPGHGISIGSLGRYEDEKDVRAITVKNCTFTGTQNGMRIKTFAPSPPNKASAITFQDIVVNDVKNPIIIDQHYCPHENCTREGESSVSIENVKFINIRGSSQTPTGVKIDCSKLEPCKDIKLIGIDLTYKGQSAKVEHSSANICEASLRPMSPCVGMDY